ncbi:MAG: tetratricopeptide repeat protein [Acidobacteria bacterium]|nr:MAG: tetratricopeptide repeat protein [Acidobacteriota bacterium]
MNRLVLVLTLALLSAGTAAAQVPADEVSEARAALEAGDLAAAVQRVEPWRERGDLPPAARAVIGAVDLELGQPSRALERLAPLADDPAADAFVLTAAGRAALALGQLERAGAYLERAVKLAPRSPAVRALGLLRGRQGRTVEAFQHLRPWALTHPEDYEARLAAALCAVELGRVPDAGKLLEGLSDDDPKVALLRGKWLFLSGDPRAAIELLRPRLAHAPPPLARDLRSVLAECYLRIGESEQAIEVLAGHVAGDPWLGLFLGRAYYQAGRLDEAAATLAPVAAGLDAGDETLAARGQSGLAGAVFLEYGRVLLTNGDAAGGLPYLERASKLRPDDRQVWQSLGQALVTVGRREEGMAALERFRQLVENEGSDLEIHEASDAAAEDPTGERVRQALKRFQRGEREKALAMLREEQKLAPEDLRPWLREVQLLLMMERHEVAAQAAAALVERFPQEPDVHYILGVAESANRHLEDAERAFRRALELAPGHTAALNDLAVILISQGRRDEARTLLQRVLALRPDDEMAKKNLERLEAAMAGG